MRKKIFALLVLGIVFAANVCFAQDVRVSDYGVDGLVAKYNEFASPGLEITSTPQLFEKDEIAGYLYYAYRVEISNGGTPVHVVFLTTPDGYVSKVETSTSTETSQTSTETEAGTTITTTETTTTTTTTTSKTKLEELDWTKGDTTAKDYTVKNLGTTQGNLIIDK